MPNKIIRAKIKFAKRAGKFKHKNPTILKMSDAPCIINTA
jgi:hypothetical protein